MGLKKWQRNEIFEAVQSAGLSPEEFDWDHGADESTFRHRPSGAYFVFGGHAGAYTSRYLAGDAPVEERTNLSKHRLDQQVELWLSAVRPDVDAPDLWAELQRESGLLGLVSDEAIDNTPFSAAEQEGIARELRTLRDQLRSTYSLSGEQMRLLDERLDYLVDAARRGVGRKDWLLILAGVLLTYGLAVALPPAAAAHILALLVKIVGHFLHGHDVLALPGSG